MRLLSREEPGKAGNARKLSGGEGDDGRRAELETETAGNELSELRVRGSCFGARIGRGRGRLMRRGRRRGGERDGPLKILRGAFELDMVYVALTVVLLSSGREKRSELSLSRWKRKRGNRTRPSLRFLSSRVGSCTARVHGNGPVETLPLQVNRFRRDERLLVSLELAPFARSRVRTSPTLALALHSLVSQSTDRNSVSYSLTMDFYHRYAPSPFSPSPLPLPCRLSTSTSRILPSPPLVWASPRTQCTDSAPSSSHSAALILDSLDQKKGSVKGLCMTEGKKGRKEGEGGRFLKIVIEVLKCTSPLSTHPFCFPLLPLILSLCRLVDRPHLQHLLTATKLLTHEPTLFVPPPTAAAGVATAVKSGNANAASKALMKAPKKKHWERPTPTPTSLGTVMLHDLLFAKRGLTLPKEHKVRKKLEKYKEGCVFFPLPLPSSSL